MIRHSLHLNFKDEAIQAEIDDAIAAFKDIKNQMKGVLNVEHRKNIGSEPSLVRGFCDVIWFDFETIEAKNAYMVHPSHKIAGGKIVKLLNGAKDGLFVCTIEV